VATFTSSRQKARRLPEALVEMSGGDAVRLAAARVMGVLVMVKGPVIFV